MKRANVLILIFPLIAGNVFSQQKLVKSKVVIATVYSLGAEVTRVAKFNLEKGENKIIFNNLPPNFDESSLQINCNDATILSVSSQKNMLDSLSMSAEYQKLQTRKKDLEHKLKLEKAIQQTITTEKDVLLSNKSLIGDQGVKLEDLKLSLTYIRSKLEEYDRTWLEKDNFIAGIEEELKKIQAQSQELYAQKITSTSEIIVTFLTTQPLTANATIKYFTQQAGWYPTYDVRVNSINDPLNLTCKANVYQVTGEDWGKVKLSVSSGNPTAGSTAPIISPWYIDIIQPYRSGYKNIQLGAPASAEKEELMSLDEVVVTGYGVKKKSDKSFEMPVSVSESQTSFTFNIDLPYDVPSRQQPITAILQNPTIKATYHYTTIPKLSEYAYLVSSMTDWQGLNLLNGDANLYFENNYVGSTYLDTKAFNDTLKLSLGKDESISVKRTKAKTFKEKNFIGSKVTESRAWEITLTNAKKQEVEIEIEDQIPVSTNEKIKVKLVDQGESIYNQSTGHLKWIVKLKPLETKKIQFSYSVEYPKESQVFLE
jgi:uncharacterized protein (TIGR02231 family)